LAALDEVRLLDWLEAHRRPAERATIRNVSDVLGCISLAGPQARSILGRVTASDLGNSSFPWLSGREIVVAGQSVRALRVSITGELGYELYAPMAALPLIHDAVMEAGRACDIANFGTAALNAMRMEKGHKGTRELNPTRTLAETGMMRFAKLDKGFFVGRDAMLAQSSTQTCVHLEVAAIGSDCHGAEAVYARDRMVGSVTSGAFAPYLERSLAFAFVSPEAATSGEALSVMVLGERRPATILTPAAYDPSNLRPRVSEQHPPCVS
jgi:dimethylglycine dehydrogenase